MILTSAVPQYWKSQETRSHTGLVYMDSEWPDQTRPLLKFEVSWTVMTHNMHLSAGTKETLFHVFLPSLATQRNKSHQQKKEVLKNKFPSDLWPGGKMSLPCLHRDQVQTEFMTTLSTPLSPHLLSTHQWTLEAPPPNAGGDRPGITHSLAS